MRGCVLGVAIVLGAAAGADATAQETLAEAFGGTVTPEWTGAVDRQYDFWLGEWRGNWRGRQPNQFWNVDRGGQLDHWLFTILDGKAMIELSMQPDAAPSGTHGFSIRYHDPSKDRWVMAQNWPGPEQSGGFLDQLQGFERFGRIQVLSTYYDSTRDMDLTRRYEFADIRDGAFRWESAVTPDQGVSWYQGTIVEFSRTRETARLPMAGEPMPNYGSGEHCTEARFKRYDHLQGMWTGTVEQGGRTSAVSMTGARFLGGCAVMTMTSWDGGDTTHRVFHAYTTHANSRHGMVLRLDNTPGTPHTYWVDSSSVLDSSDWIFDLNPALAIVDEHDKGYTSHFADPVPMGSRSRTVWTRNTADELAYRVEVRDTPDAPWRTEAEFLFRRR